MTCGIYVISNTITGGYYGGSSIDIERRWYHHKYYAVKKSNKCPYLYSAIRKYGNDNFVIKILLVCESNQLFQYEQWWLNTHIKNPLCYNVSPTAESNRGVKLTNIAKSNIKRSKLLSQNKKLQKMLVAFDKQHLCTHLWKSNTKLTEPEANLIRRQYLTEQISYSDLAEKYEVSKKTILNIMNYRIWMNTVSPKLLMEK